MTASIPASGVKTLSGYPEVRSNYYNFNVLSPTIDQGLNRERF
jgi:hypothetical protein